MYPMKCIYWPCVLPDQVVKEYEIANAIQHLAADKECQMSYPPIVTINEEFFITITD
jgi:Xaa-Pro aminopeptidase